MIISIILPVYNEGNILRDNIKDLKRILSKYLDDYEIIISEDGSTDNTLEIAKSLEDERLFVLDGRARAGKGAAIMKAASQAKGNMIVFMDADLASNPVHVNDVVKHLAQGTDIVIGSRYLKESKAERNVVRYVASKGFNFLVRLFLGSQLSDHQCGFKAFRKDAVLPIIGQVKDRGWFWDTEFLVRAQRRKLDITEIPIEWREEPDSKFNLVSDSLKMGLCLIRFTLRG
jgi:glycosyltransferase involved in cell wall biosynthesis